MRPRAIIILVFVGFVSCTAGKDGKDGTGGTTGSMGSMGAPGLAGGSGTPGAPGPAGEAGAAGDAGPRGPAAGGVVWKDATGAIVHVIAYDNPGIIHVADAAGHVWPVYTGSGAIAKIMNPQTVYYTTANCGGAAYVDARLIGAPRLVFQVVGDTSNYAIADNAVVTENVLYGSTGFAGGLCSSNTGGVLPEAAPFTPTSPIITPTSFFTAPAHPEYVP